MLYRGSIRQLGTVDEIQRATDPVVRQFIEGRPEAMDEVDRAELGAHR
jgi:ABC-type transporter Mla maintaining outer membrane lipid asymmetry ATPase subunit MlaF